MHVSGHLLHNKLRKRNYCGSKKVENESGTAETARRHWHQVSQTCVHIHVEFDFLMGLQDLGICFGRSFLIALPHFAILQVVVFGCLDLDAWALLQFALHTPALDVRFCLICVFLLYQIRRNLLQNRIIFKSVRVVDIADFLEEHVTECVPRAVIERRFPSCATCANSILQNISRNGSYIRQKDSPSLRPAPAAAEARGPRPCTTLKFYIATTYMDNVCFLFDEIISASPCNWVSSRWCSSGHMRISRCLIRFCRV